MWCGNLFYVDRLSLVMCGLIAFLGTIIINFSRRYLRGDRNYSKFIVQTVLLCCCTLGMALADNLLILLAAQAAMNYLLVRLMIHKQDWVAAQRAGILAAKFLALQILFLALGFAWIYFATGNYSLHAIIQAGLPGTVKFALGILLLGIMAGSALWPFHRWLLSSLNSPTPVSALMHAGIINSGGFLLIKLSPLYLNQNWFLLSIFVVGAFAAIIGALWKLIQSDYKRMLACSTLSQLGFMFMQCGTGLYLAAFTHLCWHSLFKAQLFLQTGGALKSKQQPKSAINCKIILQAIASSLIGTYAFCQLSGKLFFLYHINIFLCFFFFLSALQFSLEILRSNFQIKFILALTFNLAFVVMYGLSLSLMKLLIGNHLLEAPVNIGISHLVVMFIIGLIFILINLYQAFPNYFARKIIFQKIYVKALNSSQPDQETVTATHNAYRF